MTADLRLLSATKAAKVLGVHIDKFRRLGVPVTVRDPETGRDLYSVATLTEWQRKAAAA